MIGNRGMRGLGRSEAGFVIGKEGVDAGRGREETNERQWRKEDKERDERVSEDVFGRWGSDR